MKLQNKRKKTLTIAVVAIAVVIAIALMALIIGGIAKNDGEDKEVVIEKIAISVLPRTAYYVGEEFDPTGLKIQVVTAKQSDTYFIDYPNSEIKITGFDSSVANDSLVLTVSYKEFTIDFPVSIQERPSSAPVLKSVALSDNFQTTYTMKDWNRKGPNRDNVAIILTYSDGSEKRVPLLTENLLDLDRSISSPCTTQFKVRYNDNGVVVETTVTVTITN